MRIYPDEMKALPPSEKRAIMKTAQRGRRVENPAHAAMAIEYAVNYARWCRWLALMFSVLAATGIVLSVLDRRWFQYVLTLGWLVSASTWLYVSARTRRSVPLNEVLSVRSDPPR